MNKEALAAESKVRQQTVSKIEQTEDMNAATVERIVKALGVPPGTIMNYQDQELLNYLKDTATGFKPLAAPGDTQHYFKLVEKIVELYERLLAARQCPKY